MLVFIDFEASSLTKHSYPIEIGWVFEDGSRYSSLIRPAPDWSDWSAKSEAIHGISRRQLEQEGLAVEQVAATAMEVLSGHEICASAPSWDGKWLSVLLRAGGFPRHALRLKKSDDVFLAVARQIVGDRLSKERLTELVAGAIAQTEPVFPAHRALPDAELELVRLNLVQDLASQHAVT